MPQPTSTKNEHVDDDVKQDLPAFPIALLVLIFSPLTIVSAFTTYLAFAKGRIRLSVIFLFSLLPWLLILALFWNFAIEQFIQSFTVTLPQIVDNKEEAFGIIVHAILQQVMVSIPLGVAAGLGYSYYRWRTRPVWVETKFRLTPWEFFRKRKTINDISLDKNSPKDGMTLGVTETGERIVQTYQESAAHTIVFGTPGSGKTRMLALRIRDAMQNGQGICLVDLKGDPDFAREVAGLAQRYDKSFYHFTMHSQGLEYTGPALNGPASYDPVGRGEATRRKDLLIESRNWSEDYYKIQTAFYMQLVMSVIVANPDPKVSTLTDVTRLLNPAALKERSIPLSGNPIYSDLIFNIDRLNDEKMDPGLKSAITTSGAEISVLLNSVAGPWLKKDATNTNNIDLFRAAQQGEVVVFSLDTSNYPDQAKLLANLIIQDLKTVTSELRAKPASQPFSVVIDEFSAVGSTNILGLVNKSRDAKMPVTLSTQTLADLSQESNTLREQLLGNVNSFILGRTNLLSDAEELAGLSGKVMRKRFSENVIYKTGFLSRGGAIGKGNIEDVEEYAILPKDIQKLKSLEFFYINKNPMRIVKGKSVIENTEAISEPETPRNNFILRTASTIVTPEIVNSEFPEVISFEPITPPVSSNPVANTEDHTPIISTTQKADMNRLKNILRDPSELLHYDEPQVPEIQQEKTPVRPVFPQQPKTNVPPVIKAPLPTLVQKKVETPPKFPARPNFPTIPKPQEVENKTIKTPPALPKTPAIPPKTIINEPVKDDFDF